VEGHRRYADEPEPGWYSGQSSYESPPANAYDSGVHERPSGAFRLPDQRPADGYSPPVYSAPDPVETSGSHALPIDSTGTRIPVRGPEYPTIRPGGASSLADAPATYGSPAMPASAPPSANLTSGPSAAAEPTSVVPPITDRPRFPGEAVYRTRRPVSAVLIAIVTAVLLVPVVLLLIQVTFVDDPAVRGIVPAVLLTLGLPLTGLGLYSLAAGGRSGRDVWLRPPVVYLPVGLFLLLAAGLAVS
jgi:hypothetical protein